MGVAPSELERLARELGAREAAPGALAPMLCEQDDTRERVLERPGWVYELKLDGVRVLADKRGDEVRLAYRKARDATAIYPEIADAVRALSEARLVLDGEIVAFDETGRPSFQRLARRIHLSAPRDVAAARRAVPVSYVVFDLLAVGALDLRPLPLSARRALLEDALSGVTGDALRLHPQLDDGRALFALCREHGLEGVVAKRAEAAYRSGERSRDWVKVKCERDAELVVVGHSPGEGRRSRLGALDVASYEGERLVVRGRVGSGLDEDTIDVLLARLGPLETPGPTAEGRYEKKRGRVHVRPEVVVSVRYLGWSDEGSLRFPVFRGIRDDVPPDECRVSPEGDEAPPLPDEVPAARAPSVFRRVTITHPEKMFFPEVGVTKGELAGYYEAVAPALLPYLADRPAVLVRYPSGVTGRSFHQWSAPRWAPKWMRTRVVRTQNRELYTFLIDDLDGLLFVANLGCIPIQVSGARVSDGGADDGSGLRDACDFFTFDLDLPEEAPGAATFRDAVTLAHALRELLSEIGLPSFPKTSGQRGLHVVVPLGGASFSTAHALASLIARMVEAEHPSTATTEMRGEARATRVALDVGHTHPLRTIVAPYAVRAHARALVSTPLAWDEVDARLDPAAFDVRTVPARLAARGDPMRRLLTAPVDVGAVTAALEARLRA